MEQIVNLLSTTKINAYFLNLNVTEHGIDGKLIIEDGDIMIAPLDSFDLTLMFTTVALIRHRDLEEVEVSLHDLFNTTYTIISRDGEDVLCRWVDGSCLPLRTCDLDLFFTFDFGCL